MQITYENKLIISEIYIKLTIRSISKKIFEHTHLK